MKTELATLCLVIGTVMTPLTAGAADADRGNPSAFVKDSVITTKVKAKLANEQLGSLANIHVDTDRNGMVVLSGNVKTQEAADKAVSLARGTEGVTAVRSTIQVRKED